MRKFTIDVVNEKKQKKNYDDLPDDENICEKIYPNVSKAGQSYLFVWLCLKHGECLGFHMIPGSEGRKDAHASLYCYSEKVPKLIFYDHTCSLAEYYKNRESGFYKSSRFFHDIFHGYSHKCS